MSLRQTPPWCGRAHAEGGRTRPRDIKASRIAVSDGTLDDLRARLRNTRRPEVELVDDRSRGAPLAWIQEVCRQLLEAYDGRQREALLNRFAQFTTANDRLDVHFVHVLSPRADALPLALTHGWAGSVVEFHKVIAPLTDPTAHGGDAADAFHVVCPSLHGFGISARPTTNGWGVGRSVASGATLMERLVYWVDGCQRHGSSSPAGAAKPLTRSALIRMSSSCLRLEPWSREWP